MAAPAAGKIRFVINYIISLNVVLGIAPFVTIYKKKAGTLYFISTEFAYNTSPASGTIERRLQLVNTDESFVFETNGGLIDSDVTWNVAWGEID